MVQPLRGNRSWFSKAKVRVRVSGSGVRAWESAMSARVLTEIKVQNYVVPSGVHDNLVFVKPFPSCLTEIIVLTAQM